MEKVCLLGELSEKSSLKESCVGAIGDRVFVGIEGTNPETVSMKRK